MVCADAATRSTRHRHFEPEYAEVYGVPVRLHPGRPDVPKGKDPAARGRGTCIAERRGPAHPLPQARRLPRRAARRASSKRRFDDDSKLHVDRRLGRPLGEEPGRRRRADEEVDLDDVRDARPQRVAFAIAKVLDDPRASSSRRWTRVEKPWLFPQLVDISKRVARRVRDVPTGDTTARVPRFSPRPANTPPRRSSTRSFAGPSSRRRSLHADHPTVRPRGHHRRGRGSSRRKVVMDPPPTKSPLNHVVLDGLKGNTWEERLARLLEHDDRVLSYVKNDRLGFTIPYVHKGRTHDYVPDFLVRLDDRAGRRRAHADHRGVRTLQVRHGPTAAKADTARDQWCAAVNNWGEFGRLGLRRDRRIRRLADQARRLSTTPSASCTSTDLATCSASRR